MRRGYGKSSKVGHDAEFWHQGGRRTMTQMTETGDTVSATINGRLRAHVATRGGSPAIWIAPDQFRSFSQMYDIVDHIAAELRRHF